MTLHLHFAWIPLLSVAAGVLILLRPQWLHRLVAIYLIAIGVIGLLR